jgi:DNA (cytosine-5)-methyltransferase 1
LWYIDKTFTIASTQDQFIAVPANLQQTISPMSQPTSTPQTNIRFLSVCSGMEAASVAWEPLGWKAVGFSEIEPFPCAVLAHRFPNTPNYGSLTEYQSWPIETGSIDLLVGGTPCQSFSVAGLRKGLADPRGNLALVFLGLADKLKPRWIVWENVPGVLSSDGGRDFGSFLGALEQLGYGWAYRVLDAQYFGVPQRRRRVFVVASLGGRDVAASVLLKPESVCWNPAPRRKKGQTTAADAGTGVEAGGRKWPADTACTLNASFGDKQGLEDQHALGGGSLFVPAPICMSSGQANAAIAEDKAHTLNATHETQTIVTPVVIDRAAFNQGQNAQYEPHIEQTDVMDSLVARGPHAVGVPFRKSKRAQSTTDNETWVVADASNTLNNFDLGDTRTTHAVVEQQVCENHPNDSRITGPLDVAPTVVSRFGTGGGNVPLVNNEPITFQPGNLRREAGAEPSTVATTTLKASMGDQMPHIATAMAVRRLTPVECERLQGFPDNWSQIPWKGKPADQCPDGPRYKCAGNSMAVPVMRWIGEQIARVENEK